MCAYTLANMKLIVLFCVCIALASGQSNTLCRRSDPYINQCLLVFIEASRPLLRIDPVTVDRMYTDASINGVKINGTLSNVIATRGSFQIQSFNVKIINRYQSIVEGQFLIPELHVAADYYFSGSKFKTELMYFDTHGKFRGSFDNIVVAFYCEASSYYRRGEEYLKLDYVTMKVSFGNGVMSLRPLDSSWIAPEMAEYARTNPGGALQKLTPSIEHNGARLLQTFINDYLATAPLRYYLVD